MRAATWPCRGELDLLVTRPKLAATSLDAFRRAIRPMYDNEVVPQEQDRNVRLFVDADGRLTDLLSRLKLKTCKMSGISDSDTARRKGFTFVELSNRGTAVAVVNRLLVEQSPRSAKKRVGMSAKLLAHAIETFGSESSARSWGRYRD